MSTKFAFVAVENPLDGLSAEDKRKVRSRAAMKDPLNQRGTAKSKSRSRSRQPKKEKQSDKQPQQPHQLSQQFSGWQTAVPTRDFSNSHTANSFQDFSFDDTFHNGDELRDFMPNGFSDNSYNASHLYVDNGMGPPARPTPEPQEQPRQSYLASSLYVPAPVEGPESVLSSSWESRLEEAPGLVNGSFRGSRDTSSAPEELSTPRSALMDVYQPGKPLFESPEQVFSSPMYSERQFERMPISTRDFVKRNLPRSNHKTNSHHIQRLDYRSTAPTPEAPMQQALMPMQQSTAPFPQLLPGQISEPFWALPIPFKPFMPAVIEHYQTTLSPRVQALDSSPNEHTLLTWWNDSITDPAPLYAWLAFAAAHLHDAGSDRITHNQVLWLKWNAIKTINTRLKDPRRSLSERTMAAVLIMAAYEFAFGDNDAYNFHMNGIRRMVTMRGGHAMLHPMYARILDWVASGADCWRVYWPYSQLEALPEFIAFREEQAREFERCGRRVWEE